MDLKWKDDDTLEGEIPKEEFNRTLGEILEYGLKMYKKSGETELYRLPVFKKKLTYKGVPFYLIVSKTVCSICSVIHDKSVSIAYAEEFEDTAKEISFLHKKGGMNSFLNRSDWSVEGNLKCKVDAHLELAKKDIDWYFSKGKKELKAKGKKAFSWRKKLKRL